MDASRAAGASREHDTHQLHAMAPGLVGQTIERAGDDKAGCDSRLPMPRPQRLNVDNRHGRGLAIGSSAVGPSGADLLPLCPLW